MPGDQEDSEPQSPETTPSARRRSPPAGPNQQPRSKRAKYAAAACIECKKRKLKCVRADTEEECQRCISSGIECIYGSSSAQDGSTVSKEQPRRRRSVRNNVPNDVIMDELSMLREQVATLASTVGKLAADKARQATCTSNSPNSQRHMSIHEHATPSGTQEPKQPQFVGPTRSAFSLKVAETTLNKMGISAQTPLPSGASESLAPTRYPTPEQSEPAFSNPGSDVLLTMSLEEIVRLLEVFEEEVETVYPFLDTRELVLRAAEIRAFVEDAPDRVPAADARAVDLKDVILAKLAIAISIVIESHGKNHLSNNLVEPIKHLIYQLSIDAEADLKVIQIMTIISIYYFFSDEELLAWRNIGIAARSALEMGLHQNLSLVENFPDARDRGLAVRVFWCVYVLDRRWSFGTSLSFALFDRDIDPHLPEPSDDFPYLRCLIGYGRLCSKAWDALPPFSAASQSIPKDTVAFLDFSAQNWLDSIPHDLKLRHDAAPGHETRSQRRLQALLYLRGNHVRTLIHRHHVISSASIEADPQKARLVVDIAVDSISVLVHLSNTSDIYMRQQSAFNYFLLSSLAIIFLAVCHGSRLFAEACRESFRSAVELVKGFSRQGTASRRLWKSIRGLLPLAQRIGLRGEENPGRKDALKRPLANAGGTRSDTASNQHPGTQNESGTGNLPAAFGNVPPPQAMVATAEFGAAAPDASSLGNDLMFLFDAFGQTEDAWANGMQGYVGSTQQQFPATGEEEISRHFWGLI
ncbi:putative transcriptional regulatory protein [Colletotrichum sidae]|uniref:Putative transcriptional regulatory protein n=1 Tax=Colletotrichum sidae TaxID=1347389 RepID=A0A4R8T9E2_9PEZI|nr:putative transcriptional regulatory protein [Colletotrichum sidae]